MLASNTDQKSGVLDVYIDPGSDADAETVLSEVLGQNGVIIKRIDPASLGAGPQDARTTPTGRAYGGIYVNGAFTCTASRPPRVPQETLHRHLRALRASRHRMVYGFGQHELCSGPRCGQQPV